MAQDSNDINLSLHSSCGKIYTLHGMTLSGPDGTVITYRCHSINEAVLIINLISCGRDLPRHCSPADTNEKG